ncbi:hypothetical protein [Deinococcus pimensis]|uniref:hypothetical protein n=1 Tax=Deinococcus pimensis TaxID=309888 RepID=UPI00146FB202|nr:hypothetical protein [Deinococcus pimensis]
MKSLEFCKQFECESAGIYRSESDNPRIIIYKFYSTVLNAKISSDDDHSPPDTTISFGLGKNNQLLRASLNLDTDKENQLPGKFSCFAAFTLIESVVDYRNNLASFCKTFNSFATSLRVSVKSDDGEYKTKSGLEHVAKLYSGNAKSRPYYFYLVCFPETAENACSYTFDITDRPEWSLD